ncbi:MAG: hypothetical protein K8T25_10445 [Planctomycetia bacterium]|nr:hypothetical protein [Planctomycetia bacterium]
MNRQWRDIWLVVALLALVAASGCHQAPASPASAAVTTSTSRLAQGEKVTLVKEVGDFALVKSSGGETAYVPLGLLKHRNTATQLGDQSFTHTIVRETPAYPELPTTLPAPLEPRSLSEIGLEQGTLNGLYLTEKTGRQVIAPRNVARSFVDEATGERAWHAYECTNPDCPGPKLPGFKHHLFIHVITDSEGSINCPTCEQGRNLTAETPEQVRRWGQFVRPYELPETVRRRGELDAERRASIEKLRRNSAKPPEPSNSAAE